MNTEVDTPVTPAEQGMKALQGAVNVFKTVVWIMGFLALTKYLFFSD